MAFNKDILTFLDLEMNQPSEKIIQIGAVIANIVTGEVLEKINLIVNPHETLNPDIIALTGITQIQVNNGLDLEEAYFLLKAAHKKHNAFMNAYTWGGGDTIELKKQLSDQYDIDRYSDYWCFGRRFEDVKSLYRAWRMANGRELQGGLAKALTKLGLAFKGRKHDALDDAHNTMLIYRELLKKLKEGTDAKKI